MARPGALQLDKLNALLATCWEHVPFNARHWRAAGLSPRPLSKLADLASYPTIDKRAFSENYDEMRARADSIRQTAAIEAEAFELTRELHHALQVTTRNHTATTSVNRSPDDAAELVYM